MTFWLGPICKSKDLSLADDLLLVAQVPTLDFLRYFIRLAAEYVVSSPGWFELIVVTTAVI